jgi:hypothetical protein
VDTESGALAYGWVLIRVKSSDRNQRDDLGTFRSNPSLVPQKAIRSGQSRELPNSCRRMLTLPGGCVQRLFRPAGRGGRNRRTDERWGLKKMCATPTPGGLPLRPLAETPHYQNAGDDAGHVGVATVLPSTLAVRSFRGPASTSIFLGIRCRTGLAVRSVSKAPMSVGQWETFNSTLTASRWNSY